MMVNKTFRQLYEEELSKPTPAQRFVAEVAALTMRSETTVRMWLQGNQTPEPLVRKAIADKFGVDASHLFPSNNSNPVNV